MTKENYDSREVPVGDSALGYLPFKTLFLALFLALIFRLLGFGEGFLDGNASLPNLAMGISITAILLVIFFVTFLHPYDESSLNRWARKLLLEYIKFSFELCFFAIGFVVVFKFGSSNYWTSVWVSLLKGFGWILLCQHVLLLVNGDKGSTVRLVNWADKCLGLDDKFPRLKDPSFYGMLGLFFTIVCFAAFYHLHTHQS